jgi:hypothetical protein
VELRWQSARPQVVSGEPAKPIIEQLYFVDKCTTAGVVQGFRETQIAEHMYIAWKDSRFSRCRYERSTAIVAALDAAGGTATAAVLQGQ